MRCATTGPSAVPQKHHVGLAAAGAKGLPAALTELRTAFQPFRFRRRRLQHAAKFPRSAPRARTERIQARGRFGTVGINRANFPRLPTDTLVEPISERHKFSAFRTLVRGIIGSAQLGTAAAIINWPQFFVADVGGNQFVGDARQPPTIAWRFSHSQTRASRCRQHVEASAVRH